MAKPTWQMKMHMAMADEHAVLYRDDELHVQRETHTPVSEDGFGFGEPVTTYYIDNDEREFGTEAEMLAALEEVEAE